MLRELLVVGAVALAAGAGVAFAAGLVPGSADAGGPDAGSFPTGTPAGGGSDPATGDADATATPTEPPFAFAVDGVAECGETCRDVTTTLTNRQSTAAANVTVHTRIYAGNGTDGDVVWRGSEPVGDLDAGASYTTTERVELSLTDAYAVKQGGGWITVQTTVQWDGGTVTFADRYRVA